MVEGDWRKRLAEAIEASGKNPRSVSRAAGYSPGYVHGILKEGKDPTLDHLAKVCDAAGASFIKIVLGVDLDPAQERLLRLQADLPEDQKKLLLGLAESIARGNGRT